MGDALGIAQHHDGITGTSAEFVRDDYEYMILKKSREGKKVYEQYVEEVLRETTGI